MEYYLLGSTIFLGGWADGEDEKQRAEQIAQAVIEMDRPFYFGSTPKVINRVFIKEPIPVAQRK